MNDNADNDKSALLEPLRQQIDAIDSELVALLNRRAATAQEIGAIKHRFDMKVYDPQREEALIRSLLGKNEGPLSDRAIDYIYRQIIATCRSLEEKPKVAFLGPRGTFSHQAAMDYFGAEIEACPQPEFSDVAEAVSRGECRAGLLPVENAIEGFVGTSFDMVVEHHLHVVGEVFVPVELFLAANGPRDEINVVYSHAQPLKQCRKWLRRNLPKAGLIPVSSTAVAAQRAANEPGAAAVVGKLSLATTKLAHVEGPIEDFPDNHTRFWVIGRDGLRTGNKSALTLVLAHEPGSLAHTLTVFAEQGINLTQILSRPTPVRPGEYRFFLEMASNAHEPPAANIIRTLAERCREIRILGVFEAARSLGVPSPDPASEGSVS